jgi:hypothetical protein
VKSEIPLASLLFGASGISASASIIMEELSLFSHIFLSVSLVSMVSVAWLIGWALILEYTIGGSSVARGISLNLLMFSNKLNDT